jgi:hypothetical protein
MPDEKTKEQQLLWGAALKEIVGRLKHELPAEHDVPDRLRELIARLDAAAAPKKP